MIGDKTSLEKSNLKEYSKDKYCFGCNKKLNKSDSYNCWRTGCQTFGARCGNCAEFHEAEHVRFNE